VDHAAWSRDGRAQLIFVTAANAGAVQRGKAG